MGNEILRVENICKSFAGVIALDQVSLTVNQGEILCLVGENGSGKSTMIKIISGVYTPDQGDIFINGHQYKKLSPIESIREGVQVIYQDFSLFPNLTVAENLAINEQLSSGKQLVNWREIKRIARQGLEEIKVTIPLDRLAGELSTADRQLIAITKAIIADVKIIIMDEPTTALTQKEIASLFGVIKNLNEQGICTLFVSHKLNEVTEIADRTVIFRNGKKVMDQSAKSLDIKTMEFYMTGRMLVGSETQYSQVDSKESPILQVESLTLKGKFSDVSFDLAYGEVLGITGLLGSGRTELALSLFGEMPADSGRILIDGKEVRIKSIMDATRNKVGYVPEDRIREGIFLDQSISSNIVVRVIDQLINKFHLINSKSANQLSDKWIAQLDVKTPSGDLPSKSLSGGNQQRLVLAKWLASDPKILILNSPTVGVDVGSKAAIHGLIRNLANQGIGILLISDDIPELMRTCNRILLMRRGKISNEFKREDTNENQLNREMVANRSENFQ
ncbi:MAG: sugar ABC transporter ATP-binding protein [Anaerolineaceae bacterium]|nr:sugar ABC transporter ATP-binding protein [Anaerolineaceae bacterium]